MIRLYVQQKTVPEFEVVTSDDVNINEIIREICDACHQGLEYSSIKREKIDEYEEYNTTYNDIIEVLEGKLCRILDLLKD